MDRWKTMILMAAATGEKNSIVPEQVASFVHQDIDLARLKTQLCMVPDIFSSLRKESTNCDKNTNH